MRSLILKDWYTLLKQMKLMLLILVLFACIPGGALAPFAVVYAAMLPVTALAYDERSKWDELAVMMPYSTRDIVLSKYALGVMAVAAAAVIALAAQLVTGIATGGGFDSEEAVELALVVCMALVLQAVNLPIIFRLGVEKGRLGFMALLCGGVIALMAARERLMELFSGVSDLSLPFAAVLLATVLIFAASVPLSVAMYKKRRL